MEPTTAKLLRILFDPLYMILDFFVQALWGIEIPRTAKVGPGLYIGHYGGITVSSVAVDRPRLQSVSEHYDRRVGRRAEAWRADASVTMFISRRAPGCSARSTSATT